MRFFLHKEQIRKNAIDYINGLDLSSPWTIEIKKGRRSLNQNDLWHKWIDIMADHSGDTPENMKTAVKREILGMQELVSPLTGEIYYVDYETHKMTKDQFSKLMTQTIVLASEYYGLSLPSMDFA